MKQSGLSAIAARFQLLRLRGKLVRVSPRQPFFLIVGPEHRNMGAPPANWWLQDYFNWLGRPYYLALQSAASAFGSNPQALQVTQVMTDLPSMRGPDGKVYLVVCCDVPAIWAAYPVDKIFELDARVVLEMAQSSGVGVIVQNILDGNASWAAVPREDVADVLSGRHSSFVVVPPGHKVVVVKPQPVPQLGQCESGMWIAELGNGAGLDGIISRVRQLVTQARRTNVIWIVQPSVLESSNVFNTLVSALVSVVRESAGGTGHIVVVPYAADRHVPQLRRLKQTGVRMHHAGPHGECFVEVHKPDGIVVGMPGRAFVD